MESQRIIDDIALIRQERNVENRLKLLEDLNNSLPGSVRLEFPSLMTNAYVRKALDILEERIRGLSLSDPMMHTQV